MKETRDYHTRYLRAINSPVRRKILRVLRKADSTFDELQSSTGLEGNSLRWHLNLLESGCCIEKNTKEGRTIYSLTQEGKVVDYIE